MSIIKDFTFNGKTASSFGVQLADNSEWWATPERDIEHISVPGRSGDLLIDNGRFNNLEINFEVNKISSARDISDLINWLALNPGYQKLTVTDDLDHYRMASFEGMTVPVFTQLKESAKVTIPFNCKPQRYLITDETGRNVSLGHPLTITNLGDDAKPLLDIMLYFNNSHVSSATLSVVDTDVPGETLVYNVLDSGMVPNFDGHSIDSASMESYGIVNGVAAPGYQFMYTTGWSNTFGEQEPFLILKHGHTYTFTANTDDVIHPRRWEL